jgi:hypothetical protein
MRIGCHAAFFVFPATTAWAGIVAFGVHGAFGWVRVWRSVETDPIDQWTTFQFRMPEEFGLAVKAIAESKKP